MTSFRSDIQGLRAIAVLAVMLFHYDRQLLPGGYIGVDVFFVISGFLITSILLKQKEKLDFSLMLTLKHFYIGRIKRIAPAYYVLLMVVMVVSAVVFIPKDFQFFSDSLRDSLWFFSNQYFAGFGNYFAPKSDELPLLHTWSLAIEMQFYLFYPFLILLLKESWIKCIIPFLIVILTLLSSYLLHEGQAQSVYYGLYARVPEFLVGACIVLFSKQLESLQFQSLSFVGLILIICSFFLIDEATKFPGIYALFPVLGAGFLLFPLSSKQSFVKGLLSNPALVWIGAISYSLYLWHWPILAFIRYISGSYGLTLEESIFYWTATFLLASASYYFIEEYFRKKQLKSLTKKLAWTSLVVFVMLISVLSRDINKVTSPPELAIELTRYADPDTICHGKIVGDCIRGDKNSKKKPILVLGDSHAAMLNHFFDVVGNELNLSFRVITASSCITIPSFDYQNLPEWAHKPCMDQINHSEKFIASSKKIIVAGMWSYQLKENNLANAINVWLSEKATKEKSIYFFSDVPQLDNFHPLKNNRFEFLGLQRFSFTSIKNEQQANEAIKNQLLKYSTVQYVNLYHSGLFNLMICQ